MFKLNCLNKHCQIFAHFIEEAKIILITLTCLNRVQINEWLVSKIDGTLSSVGRWFTGFVYWIPTLMHDAFHAPATVENTVNEYPTGSAQYYQ